MLYAAAVILVLLGLVHSVLGERMLVSRLLKRDNLPKMLGSDVFTKHTIRYCWHLTSLLAFGMAWMLVQISEGDPVQALVRTVAITLLLGTVLAVVLTRARHLSWVFFLMAAIICLRYAGWPAF